MDMVTVMVNSWSSQDCLMVNSWPQSSWSSHGHGCVMVTVMVMVISWSCIAAGNKDTWTSLLVPKKFIYCDQQSFFILKTWPKLNQNKHALAACHCSVAIDVSLYPISSLIMWCLRISPANPCFTHKVTTNTLSGHRPTAEPFPECLENRSEQD